MRLHWLIKLLILLVLSALVFGGGAWVAYQVVVKPNKIPKEELVNGKPSPPPDPSLPEFEKAMSMTNGRQPVEARAALEKFIETYPFSTKLSEARKALGRMNTDIFFSSIPAPEKIRYEVRPGDALAKIEHKFRITGELIMRCNNLEDPRRLRVGQVLMISQPQFTATLDRKNQTLTLFNNGKFFKQYDAASWNTPAPKKGMEKIEIPAKVGKKMAWSNGAQVAFGSKEYAGSARWVELTAKGYTLYTEGGQKPSSGVGMSPEDMEEISTLLEKGNPVTIK